MDNYNENYEQIINENKKIIYNNINKKIKFNKYEDVIKYLHNIENYIYPIEYDDLERIKIEINRINQRVKTEKIDIKLKEHIIEKMKYISSQLSQNNNQNLEAIKKMIIEIELLLSIKITFYSTFYKIVSNEYIEKFNKNLIKEKMN